MARRRGRGEGSIAQVHGAKWGCPEPVESVGDDGEVVRTRPRHRCTGPWRAQIDLGRTGGKRRRVSVERPTKAELLVAREELLGTLGQGVNPSKVTVSEWLDVWMRTAELKPYTRRGYESVIRVHIKPRLGDRPLQRLVTADVRDMVADLKALGLKPQTIQNVLTPLKRALTVAERDRMVSRNVASHVEVPSSVVNPHAILTPDQALLVLNSTRDTSERARLMIALMGGLRQSEALALRWRDVELVPQVEDGHILRWAGWVHVTATVARVGKKWVWTTPKSARSRRSAPMAAALAETLAALRPENADRDALVFPNPDRPDEPVMPWDDHRAWKAACRRAGVPEVPLHGARGTLETMLIHNGVTMTDSAAMLGHDPLTAARHYARATQASQAALAARVDELLGGARDLPAVGGL